jgi:hypothetical protein
MSFHSETNWLLQVFGTNPGGRGPEELASST